MHGSQLPLKTWPLAASLPPSRSGTRSTWRKPPRLYEETFRWGHQDGCVPGRRHHHAPARPRPAARRRGRPCRPWRAACRARPGSGGPAADGVVQRLGRQVGEDVVEGGGRRRGAALPARAEERPDRLEPLLREQGGGPGRDGDRQNGYQRMAPAARLAALGRLALAVEQAAPPGARAKPRVRPGERQPDAPQKAPARRRRRSPQAGPGQPCAASMPADSRRRPVSGTQDARFGTRPGVRMPKRALLQIRCSRENCCAGDHPIQRSRAPPNSGRPTACRGSA